MDMRSKKFPEIHADVGLFGYDQSCQAFLFLLTQVILTHFNLDSNLDWNLGSGLSVRGWATQA